MTDQDSVADKKAASAAGAGDNVGIGVDGDGPSAADTNVEPTAADPSTPDAPQESDSSGAAQDS